MPAILVGYQSMEDQAEPFLLEGYLPAPSLSENQINCSTTQPFVAILPAGYNSSTDRYPVIYFLHGFSMGIDSFDDVFPQVQFPEDMIVVLVNGFTVLGGSFYENSEVTGNWEDYVVNDVVNFVDSEFRTITNASMRGIAGLSMGGYSALNIAMKHPDVFGSVYAISPGLFDEEGLLDSAIGDQYTIEFFLKLESDLLTLENDTIAHLEYLSRVDNLLSNDRRRFVLAYGSAFSPNQSKRAPYIDYLFSREEGEIKENASIRDRWEGGFGGIAQEVEQYSSNLRGLIGIGIEYSDADVNTWIPRGCLYLSEVLHDHNIEHNMVNTTYGHASQLRLRIETFMMPFFAEVFHVESLIDIELVLAVTSISIIAICLIGLGIRSKMKRVQ